MKEGWIISVKDKLTKDRAFRLVIGDRDKVKKKAISITKKHRNRLKVSTNIPYTELDTKERIILEFQLIDSIKIRKLLLALEEFFPLVIKKKDSICYIEINKTNLTKVNSSLDNRIKFVVSNESSNFEQFSST